MKTAISLSDSLFQRADAFAERAGISRSELYATAVAEYLARRDGDRITAKLNAIYGAPSPPSEPELAPSARFPASRADLW
jgi:metal-responsive CopG/Arc/MetJ family transcriptional regulator